MKQLLFTLIGIILLISCDSSDDPGNVLTSDIVGTWQLTANLSDPGDGSGSFQSVSSNKTITFNADGTFTSNGDVCDMSITTSTNTNGTYNTTDKTINANCGTTNLPISYTIDNLTMDISYFCIEACQSRYRKIN
ncbi:lipocalin family protein [Nonlabens ulvanivorans]|uniref:lipocalin family protein n=1 Tax=Nonlabens ulvanivorans TaxID=906888 RepID=UPI0029424D3C|nr:lipocalin family protein [Nonlabens ulvanivorans]WOI23408.1 lipocalin family protein [Nonlabens ulvanivorans]